MICSKCCYCSVVGSKFYCAIKDGHIEGYPEICSQFHPVKDCGRCKNDPAFFNAMRDLCNPADIDRLISWFCRGRLCSTCPYNGIECGIRDWLEEEVKE